MSTATNTQPRANAIIVPQSLYTERSAKLVKISNPKNATTKASAEAIETKSECTRTAQHHHDQYRPKQRPHEHKHSNHSVTRGANKTTDTTYKIKTNGMQRWPEQPRVERSCEIFVPKALDRQQSMHRCQNVKQKQHSREKKRVPITGIEPVTSALQERCSAFSQKR